jgi:hypothetical protein
VTVNVSSNTTIQKTTTGTLSDLHEGDSLTVIGTQDTSGNITATSIIIRPEGQGTPQMPFAPVVPNPGGTPTTPSSGTNPGFTGGGARHSTNGTLTKIDGNILTLTTAQGSVTVNVGSDTTIQKTTAGTLSDLHEGDSLTVIGNQDASGNITATSIIIRPEGQGAPTPTETQTPSASAPSVAKATTSFTMTLPGIVNGGTVYPSASNANVGIYSDANCTSAITVVDFGSVAQGKTSSVVSVYFRNLTGISAGTTSTPFIVTCSSDISSSLGYVSFTGGGSSFPNNSFTLEPGTTSTGAPIVIRVDITFTASSSITTSPASFNINFACSSTS